LSSKTFGDLDRVLGTHRHAKPALKLLNSTTDRCLRKTQRLGRASEASVLGHQGRISQVSKIKRDIRHLDAAA
jgi:hypothetical protein